MAGKERSQEEFFHTFNTLFDGRKQIVLSSDRPASEVVNLEQRFVSRFECGLTTELLPQDIETRIAISPEKGPGIPIELAEDILASLAQRVRKAEALIVRSREVRRPAEPVSSEQRLACGQLSFRKGFLDLPAAADLNGRNLSALYEIVDSRERNPQVLGRLFYGKQIVN
jgi:hypothetical protein